MNIRLIKKLISSSIFLLFTISINAQVTIGSGAVTNIGSLLDLKEEDKTDGTANSKRGLGLPRVNLKNAKSLIPIVADHDGTPNLDYAGMMVYNVSTTDDLCNYFPAGAYVWAGDMWQTLSGKPQNTVVERPSTQHPITALTGLDQPNSYIVTTSSVVKIPIEKAVTVWDGSSWLGDIQEGVTTLSPVLPTARTFGALSAELVWDDNCGNLLTNADNLQIISEGGKDYIEVWVGNNKGNALVALKDGNDIVWSWHIWATDDPTATTYALSNGVSRTTFMDRNLGAVSATPGNALTKGNYYQWGRKDPFPAHTSKWDRTDAVLFTLPGSETAITKDVEVGLESSIAKPSNYMTVAYHSNVHNDVNDWYTPTEGLWNNRWGADGQKAVSDPCPEGWRVPVGDGASAPNWDDSTTPWNILIKPTDTNKWNKGWTFDDVPVRTAGYYPAADSYSYAGKLGSSVGTIGYMWSASTGISSASGKARYGRAFSFQLSTVSPKAYQNRIYGLSVRCAKNEIYCPPPGDRPAGLPVVTTSEVDGLKQPNSYIVTQESLVKIPIDKARKIWDGASWKDDNNTALLPSQSLTNLSADLVWKDVKCGLIKEIKLNGEYIEVWVGDEKGNASIALKDGAEIVWSWHIWATDQPFDDVNPIVHNTGVQTNIFMDRNVGAISATPQDANSRGLLYQWGRKDPFVGGNDWTNTPRTIYDTTNKVTKDNKITPTSSEEANLGVSIGAPLAYITGIDWYSLSTNRWRTRWGHKAAKAVTDPCPEHWRVPSFNDSGATTADSPWAIAGVTSTDPSNYTDTTLDKGYDFSDKSNFKLGWYPAAGTKSNLGVQVLSGTGGVYWTALARTQYISSLYFTNSDIQLNNLADPTNAYSIRCVKE